MEDRDKAILLMLTVGFIAAMMIFFALIARSQTTSRTLLWTAPGDDGAIGRATRYDLRISRTAITGTDTLSWWNQAAIITGLPTPSIAGATDSMIVTGLQASSHYYAIIRAADEVPNWSGFSNVAQFDTPDLLPPSAIIDLRPR